MRNNLLWIVLLLAALPAGAHEITGRVNFVGRPNRAQVTTIVYAEPLDAPAPARPQRARLLQRNKSFQPRVLAIPAGSSVDFVNEDMIFHNVFSLSPPTPFDLGLYRAGASKARAFSEPAVYRVFCNIHPDMAAVILVVGTPYFTTTDAAGNYRLDLPPGRYRLTAWSERAQPVSVEVTVTDQTTTAPPLTLDESHFVELPHKNKFGQDYAKPGYDPLRDKKPN
jgi:plastocyanin